MSNDYTPDTFWPVVRCDKTDCTAETGHPDALTTDQVRHLRAPEGWRTTPDGHDLCPTH
jgi:hypothetical protein